MGCAFGKHLPPAGIFWGSWIEKVPCFRLPIPFSNTPGTHDAALNRLLAVLWGVLSLCNIVKLLSSLFLNLESFVSCPSLLPFSTDPHRHHGRPQRWMAHRLAHIPTSHRTPFPVAIGRVRPPDTKGMGSVAESLVGNVRTWTVFWRPLHLLTAWQRQAHSLGRLSRSKEATFHSIYSRQ